jgi:hypothetical protein
VDSVSSSSDGSHEAFTFGDDFLRRFEPYDSFQIAWRSSGTSLIVWKAGTVSMSRKRISERSSCVVMRELLFGKPVEE